MIYRLVFKLAAEFFEIRYPADGFHCIKSDRIWSYSGPLFPYSVQPLEHADQTNSEYRLFLRSVCQTWSLKTGYYQHKLLNCGHFYEHISRRNIKQKLTQTRYLRYSR